MPVQENSVDVVFRGEDALHMIRAELSVLADDVIRLENDVVLHDAARFDYESATHRYRVAQAALERFTPNGLIDLTRVQRLVDEASWSMSRAKAIVQGYPAPEPPPNLQHPGPRGEPAVRIDEDDRPAYVGAPITFQSEWFSAGGLLGGLMMGSALGSLGGWAGQESSDGIAWDGYGEDDNSDE